VPAISRRLSRWWTATPALVLLGMVSCRDSPTDLLPGVVAARTQPALALGVVLPDPSDWSVWAADGGPGGAALDAWISSWDLPTARGRQARERSYEALVGLVPPDRRADLEASDLTQLQRALEGARSLPADAIPAEVGQGLARAESEEEAAVHARHAREIPEALIHVLRGADALREVGPEAVARTLVGQVERAMRSFRAGDTYSSEDLERLRRLVQGGDAALESGNWVLAIRRAYYARALMASKERR
jgi:hypothetical protein